MGRHTASATHPAHTGRTGTPDTASPMAAPMAALMALAPVSGPVTASAIAPASTAAVDTASPALIGLVLAAGESSRFGGRKQLADIDGQAMLSRVIARLGDALGQMPHVVLGAYHDDIAPIIAGQAHIVFNPDWASGMGGSIACGAAAIRAQITAPDPAQAQAQAHTQAKDDQHHDQSASTGAPGILITLGDQPAIETRHFTRLIASYDGQRITASQYDGRLGVPAIFPYRYLDRLAALSGPRGAQAILRDACENNALLALPLPEAAQDIDTPGDLARFTTAPLP